MKAAFRTSLAAAGVAAACYGAPAMADVSMADQQHIARALAERGYSRVTITEDDGDVVVLGTRDGVTHAFAYEPDYRQLVSVGEGDGDGSVEAMSYDDYDDDRGGDNNRHGDRRGGGGHDGGMGRDGD